MLPLLCLLPLLCSLNDQTWRHWLLASDLEEEEEEEGGDVFAANVDTLTGVDTAYTYPLPNPQFIPHCPR